MATAPKPKPKPDPEPDPPEPEEDEAAATEGITLNERVENLENRMTALEERVAAPPVGLGRRA
jgi:hypothetical protein